MTLIAKPNTFSPNTTASSSEVNDNFDTIYNDYNGGISGANLATGAVTTAKLADDSVTSAKIAAGTIVAADLDADLAKGWTLGLGAPTTVTANGNRSYSVVYNSSDKTGTVSTGMRLRLTRTVTAPTQCTSLNGTTQYYSKASPSAMTFTDDFTVSAWVKLSSYPSGVIASRYNGTSGWSFAINASGQIYCIGYNAGAANSSYINSYQAVPLNKWVHITAQLDMSTFTATTTTSYIMIDGLDVPAFVARTGTNPTALIQAGSLEIGSQNSGATPFPGKIAQVAIYNAKVTQATVLASISQTLTGSETSLISAYSFNNSINDLSANANNLTANGSAVATSADSPFGVQADGTTAGTTEYAEILAASFSTNTTLTVRVPDGNMIPTSGGVSAVSYSTQDSPYGMPKLPSQLGYAQLNNSQSSITALADINGLTTTVYVPAGRRIKIIGHAPQIYSTTSTDRADWTIREGSVTLQTSYGRAGISTDGWGGATVMVILSPSAGSHTYKMSLAIGAGIGSGTIFSDATTGHSYIEVLPA